MALLELLAQRRIRAIMDELQDIRQLPQRLLFVGRIPSVSAEDEEIMARYTGRVVAADIIADDQKAVVRAANPITLETNKIPNLKHGEKVTQAMINVLQRIESNLRANLKPGARDMNVFDNYLIRRLDALRTGVFERMEAIDVAMVIDALTYDRLGIKITGTWGMPSDLKVTIGTAWSDTTNATPITDIHTVQRVGREKYGVNLNRITMSTPDFDEMTATTEFRNKAALYSQFVLPTAGTFPVQDVAMMKTLAGRMLGSEVEIYDAQTWTEGIDGTQTAARYLPTGKIALTSTDGDNNGAYWDWANGVVTESIVASMVDMPLGGFGGPVEGPVGYVTAPNADLNPPDLTMWAVARGFTRKHQLAASAVLTNP
jgi:hypothetical protein